ncbi:diheme cytochrome c [Poseidonibacter lekithochrous]|uniref:diheme cytochrome c n=1 Tax=Poseidonibacter TaxID=2321187 RepID=UPI001C0998B7|nr:MULTISPECIES: diheme cytochrome c [Poseidonibacter]MBU3014222.1 diheme cytochrome c [Poseidonibacter lekithochrous]MDO6827519.1 diheme cytochrome c [Poseidonibacter sp. 1_MG-2023]
MNRIVFILVAFSIIVFASNYEGKKSNGIQNSLYLNECSSCHMGFQAEFLPQRSWNKMMDTLDDHFGVDATFDKSDEVKVREYLLKNASDAKRGYGEMKEFSSSISRTSTPLAITEIPKFKREHREVPKRLIVQKDVQRISNCMACHTDAKEGLYKERNILIPNFGRWDD